ncbi:L10-interacting MYB domain-containing protein-like [Phragmites australis]|uniref:L10-interacting MYB domain-containing protein-like n=1 Tax=Phragmites australis TaxID=29695 RepID=UPI002D79D2FE|nr:L10-interacting MYB domain-containing protein-like [Phragmites australis]
MVEWSDENTMIVCELFAEQVRCGNRSSTHLNNVGYNNVIEKFQKRTSLLYKRSQFKNKWAKLKREFGAWNKLLTQTGLGWDENKGTVKMSEEWYQKFKEKPLQNEEELKVTFEDLRNTGDDHFCASSGVIPQDELDGGDELLESDDDNEAEEITPPVKAKGKRACGAMDKGKRPRTSGGQWIQEQITKIVPWNEKSAASVESLAKRDETSGCSIKDVMSLVKECGASPGTKEFFIATELFTERAEREMFMTIDAPLDRFQWLSMKHFVKCLVLEVKRSGNDCDDEDVNALELDISMTGSYKQLLQEPIAYDENNLYMQLAELMSNCSCKLITYIT